MFDASVAAIPAQSRVLVVWGGAGNRRIGRTRLGTPPTGFVTERHAWRFFVDSKGRGVGYLGAKALTRADLNLQTPPKEGRKKRPIRTNPEEDYT